MEGRALARGWQRRRLLKLLRRLLSEAGILSHNSWDKIGSLTFPLIDFILSQVMLSTFTMVSCQWSVVSHIILQLNAVATAGLSTFISTTSPKEGNVS